MLRIMNILLIEDELPAYRRLRKMLLQQLPDAQISEQLESISATVSYLQNKPEPQLIFMDIQLADGLSFSIFEQVEIQSPIIFTTAFDQYTLKAFKVHSVDYLLKPVRLERLTKAVGKSKAMEMCLTGRMMDAEEAERSNLVARVVPHDTLLDEALKTAAQIASMPPMAAIANKEMVNAAFETSLDQGLIIERRIFQILAASEDKAEGMAAFVEKREGKWKGR